MFYSRRPKPSQVRRLYCLSHACGERLKAPNDDRRLAFCGPLCERAYWAFHCIVCESATTKRSKNRAVCGRSKCRHALQRHPERYRLRLSKTASRGGTREVGQTARENSTISTPKTVDKIGRAYRVIAGPNDLHPINLITTEIPVSEINKAFVKHRRDEASKAIFQRDTPPLNVIGGYRFPNAPNLDWGPAAPPRNRLAEPSIGDGLEIPAFLRRADWSEDSQ